MHRVVKTTKKSLIQKNKKYLSLTKVGKGADSVMTVFMKTKDPQRTLAKQAGMHTFFTPYLDGLSGHAINLIKDANGQFFNDKVKIFNWVKEWYRRNTYEISVPVLRDTTLAPTDESGFIVSVLLDYQLTKFIADQGWYEDLKQLSNTYFVDILDQTWLKGLKKATYETMHASPLTMEKFAAVHQGSLSGWSFTNKPMLSEFFFTRVAKSILTPYPKVFQAGQWAFAPAGLPTCALTGKLAADKVLKLTKG
jgi:phytoene dehydrogenase-like protein